MGCERGLGKLLSGRADKFFTALFRTMPSTSIKKKRLVSLYRAHIQRIWEKATVVPGYDPNLWRKDQCGAWICRDDYGERSSDYGWELDHIILRSHGGSDRLFNLRPLHWQNNASRQDSPLICPVRSFGTRNGGL